MNIEDLYSTRIQKSFDEDQAEIITRLQENSRQQLKLINYYKGIPLSYPAGIVSINRGALDLDLQETQAFTIQEARSTFIRAPFLKYDLFAQAQYVNVRKRAATFVRFSYVEILAERRNFVRVDLDDRVPVAIQSPSGIVKGILSDLSLSGLGILLDHISSLAVGAETELSFKLICHESGEPFEVRSQTTVVNIRGDVPPYSYRFAITPDKFLERHLSQYIFQRQIEIIRQVKEAVS